MRLLLASTGCLATLAGAPEKAFPFLPLCTGHESLSWKDIFKGKQKDFVHFCEPSMDSMKDGNVCFTWKGTCKQCREISCFLCILSDVSVCVSVWRTVCCFWSQTVVSLLCVSLFECQNITNILWGKKADMDTWIWIWYNNVCARYSYPHTTDWKVPPCYYKCISWT